MVQGLGRAGFPPALVAEGTMSRDNRADSIPTFRCAAGPDAPREAGIEIRPARVDLRRAWTGSVPGYGSVRAIGDWAEASQERE